MVDFGRYPAWFDLDFCPGLEAEALPRCHFGQDSVKSPASAAKQPLSGIDSGNYNNKQEAACNLINYKRVSLSI